jgi:hypothetical protein
MGAIHGRGYYDRLLALRSRADSVAHISKFFRPLTVFGYAALDQEQMDQEACPTA